MKKLAYLLFISIFLTGCQKCKKNKNKKSAITTQPNANDNSVSLNSMPHSNEYTSFHLAHDNSAKSNYAKIDEEKKLEQQYDTMPKIDF